MPNRIIKESICTSEEIDALPLSAEVLFYRLMVNADDYGRLDARPKLVASKCYPLKSIDIKLLQADIGCLQMVGLVQLYAVSGKPFIQIVNWAKHQQIRAQRAKFPGPEEGSDITCNQLISDVHVIQSNPIQSESNTHLSAVAERVIQEAPALFVEAWDAYPKREGGDSRASALKQWRARVKAGVPEADLLAGVKRYAAYCDTKKLTGTQFVKQASSFFGTGEHWTESWDVAAKADDATKSMHDMGHAFYGRPI